MEILTKEPLFQDNSQALIAARDNASVARATQEIQAALVIAQRYPRDEIKAKSKIVQACCRKDLAELSEYEYSRGGTRITGPTIDLLRAIANRWGNIRFGWAEVERREGQSSIRCFAWDMQTNGQSERTFTVRHWRDTRDGGYQLEDERDIYELLANQASRRVRACLEEVIDADMVSAAIDQCRLTLKDGEKTPITDRAVKMLVPFAEFGVTQAMIETRLGNKLEAVSENQLASLRRVYKSLKDGVGKREDYFKPDVTKPEFEEPKNSKTAAEVKKEKEPKPKENPPEPEPEPPRTDPATPEPEKTPAPSAGTRSTYNPLKALRNLLSTAGYKEGKLLDLWNTTGATDGSQSSLEEVQMTSPDLIIATAERWTETLAQLKAAK